MGLNQKDTYGADGSLSGLTFDPDKLYLVVEEGHPLYDERVHDPLDEAMVKSIMHHGVIEPVVISRNPETGRIDVVAGRQRVKNCREANRRLRERGEAIILVPTIIRKTYDLKELAGVGVSENEIRRPDGPIVKARKIRHLETMGHDLNAIALHFGVSPLTIKHHMELIDCSQEVQSAVERGLIGISDIGQLSPLTHKQQRAKIEQLKGATDGKKGHARASAKRAVLAASEPGAKPSAPKLRGRKEIAAKIKEISECGPLDVVERKGWHEALEWVLGNASAEPEKDTKTVDLFDASKTMETAA